MVTDVLAADEADAELLEALAATLDRRLASHARLSSEVSGDGYVVAHQIELVSADGTGESHTIYVETSPKPGERTGVLNLRNDETGEEVAVWVYPNDPGLPALPAVVFPDAARVILNRLGVDIGDSDLSLALASYRPGKRAVVQVASDRAVVYLKVVAPKLVAALAKRHSLWASADLPVPLVLGWSDEGLLALATLDGTPASAAIERLDAGSFPSALRQLQRRISRVPSSEQARPSLSSRLDWYVRRLAQAAPAEATRIEAVGKRIATTLAANPAPPPVTIHGDLHVGQVFIDDAGEICGVLDIDTAGLGDPADDAAAMYAHLIVTAALQPSGSPIATQCEALANRWREGWSRKPDDASYSVRASAIAATHLLAHALSDALDVRALVERAEELANIRGL